MNKLKILSSGVAALVLTANVMAGGDPRDFGPVESFDSLDSILYPVMRLSSKK